MEEKKKRGRKRKKKAQSRSFKRINEAIHPKGAEKKPPWEECGLPPGHSGHPFA